MADRAPAPCGDSGPEFDTLAALRVAMVDDERFAHLERVERDAAAFVRWYDVFDAESREGYRGFVRDNAHRNATNALRRLRLALGPALRDDARDGGGEGVDRG